MAVIIPIPKTVLDDADYDIWTGLRPQISAAIGAKWDASLIFGESGVDVPQQWPDGLLKGMPSDHFITEGEIGDLYDDIMGVGGVLSKVEEDGFFVDGHVAALQMKAKLRGLRGDEGGGPGTGRPLFIQDMKATVPYSLDGVQLEFPRNGSFDPSIALLISGDWKQLVWSVRRDVTFDIFTEGVITSNASPRVIQHNLMQDDMIAMRVTFRAGWQLPNPVNRVQPTEADRFPFAALLPAGVYSV
jgi:HK97 family phage major capsid protein